MGAVAEISCVIPTYQSVAFAERCLNSIVAQADVRMEVIVSDDSATPDVRAFVERFAKDHPQVRWFPGARTGNPVDNWNKGLDQGEAPCAVLIHHDELLRDTGYLRRAVDALAAGRGKVVVAAHDIAGEGGRTWFGLVSKVARALRFPSWTLYMAGWIGPTAAFVFRTEGDPRFDPRLTWLVDCDFYARQFDGQDEVVRDDAVCVVSTRHAGQITARVDPRVLALQEIELLAASNPGRLKPWQWRLARAYAALRLRLRR